MKTISINGKTLDYTTWRNFYGGWGAVAPKETHQYSRRRLPLPDSVKERRAKHMKQVRAQGAPYAWIARLYQLDRAQVWRIINDVPNN